MTGEFDKQPSASRDVIEGRLIASAFPGTPAVRALNTEESQLCARRLYRESRGLKEIDGAMRELGLVAMIDRARAYIPFSQSKGRVKHIAVVPYASPEPEGNLVGGIGLSDGEPASGVVVELRKALIARVVTFDMLGGKLASREFAPKEILRMDPHDLREGNLEREELVPDVSVDTAASIAGLAFRTLLTDEHSSMVHSPADMRRMIYNAPVVSAMAQLQHVRLEGLVMSPGTSCCCCSCCCWGSCSSCSADASHYLNETYYQQITT